MSDNQPYLDVRAFMRIGQPDQLPSGLHLPVADAETARELLDAATVLLLHSSRCSKVPGPLAFRARLMLEELGETLRAMANNDAAEVADGLVDLEYVTIGTALAFGIPHDAVWQAVHNANMRKYPNGVASRDAQGKVQKPPGWKPANVAALLGLDTP